MPQKKPDLAQRLRQIRHDLLDAILNIEPVLEPARPELTQEDRHSHQMIAQIQEAIDAIVGGQHELTHLSNKTANRPGLHRPEFIARLAAAPYLLMDRWRFVNANAIGELARLVFPNVDSERPLKNLDQQPASDLRFFLGFLFRRQAGYSMPPELASLLVYALEALESNEVHPLFRPVKKHKGKHSSYVGRKKQVSALMYFCRLTEDL